MKIGKKNMPSAIVLIFILTIGVLLGSYFYITFLEKQFDLESRAIMKQETGQVGNSINDRIDHTFVKLEYISGFVAKQDDFSCEKGIEQLNIVNTGDIFKKIGIADSKGTAYMSDGTIRDVSEEEFFKCSIQGGNYVTDTMVDEENEFVNIYSVCIFNDNKCAGVLFGICLSDNIDERMNLSEGGISSQFSVVKPDGTILFGTIHQTDSKGYGNLFEVLENKTNEKSIDKLTDNLQEKDAGFIVATYEGEENIIYSEPMERNDWYLVAMLSSSALNEQKDKTLFQTNVLIAAFLFLYLVTIIFIIFMQEKNKRHIERLAYVDELTGGISFAKFKQDADKLVKNSTDQYALVDLDVDKFKYINDIFGYEEGNHVIRFIWKAINNIIESGETFAHYRADRFVLLLKANDMDHVIKRVEALSVSASNRAPQSEKNYEIVLSVGIYIIDRINYRIDTAIDRAALTKKSIKGKHSQTYAIYDEKIRQKVLRDQEIENMMEKALKNEEFMVYYQPKYDSTTCELAGSEALVRWYNEEIGMIFPMEFISVFENNGFISELDTYMFEHVCRDIRKWLDEGYNVVPVSVNLSQLQLYNMRFIEDYKAILEKYDIPTEYVQLELTETTLFSKANSLNKIIDELHEIGFKILMDDFGTGYSSLNMLKNVQVDILKLDKSFVDDIGDPKGDIVVSTIVSLGQLLDMKIVAEGVETKEQFEFLRDIFCDEIQGYYFSRPIPEDEYRKKMMKGAL